MAIEGNHTSGAAYFRFAEEMDPDMVQVQVDNGKTKGLASVKAWILTNWRLLLGIIIALILLGIGIIIGHAIVSNPIRSKAGVSCTCQNNTVNPPQPPQQNITQLFQRYVSAENLQEYFRKFTKGAHHAGSPGNKEMAGYITERWKSFGFDVHNKTYRVTLSRPNLKGNQITVIDPDGVPMNLDIRINDTTASGGVDGMLPAFNPYSATNETLVGLPFFVNYGRLEDFKFIKDVMLPKQNVKGNICVAKLGVMPLSRLVTNCEDKGAIAVLAFPDKALYAQSAPSRDNWWLPLDGITRDSARSTYGDPGSFFYPALDDYSPDLESLKLPSIPVQVISYDDANGILRSMDNPPAPPDFHSNSSTDQWFMGPGFHNGENTWIMHMMINTNVTMEKITNVIGVMKGSIEPDRYVIVGSHRDSLAYGGVEPGTGSACLMELARALGELKNQGWKPRRTIILASWDAGEEGHIGSTEWVEEHLEILHERAVAYINLDEAVSGKHSFVAEGSPLLSQVVYKATKMIDCPDKGHTNMMIYENWSQKRPISETNAQPRLDPPGTTSDITPFLHLAGVPSVDLKYMYDENMADVPVPTYPLMHTAYDNVDYVTKIVDPDFSIHSAVTKVAGEVVLELANAPLLLVKVDDYADELVRYAGDLAEQYSTYNFSSLIAAAEKFDEISHSFQTEFDLVNVSVPGELRDINDHLMAVERAFLGDGGMTVQEQQLRHVVYGPSVNHPYKGVAFPLLANNLFIANVTGDDAEFRRHLPRIASMIRVAAKVLNSTTDL